MIEKSKKSEALTPYSSPLILFFIMSGLLILVLLMISIATSGATFPVMIVIIPFYLIYFLPFLIANQKKHINETSIFLVNLFLGWTLIGWIVSLVWAVKKSENITKIAIKKNESPQNPIDILKRRLVEGQISEAEYLKKKKLLE